jgi:glycosyltransferase involved in cell wall biosynthesis
LAWLKDTFYIVVGKLLGSRIVLHVHAAEFNELYRNQPSVIRFYTRKVMAKADVVIAVSEEWRKFLTEILPINRIMVLRNCLDGQAIRGNPDQRCGQPVKALFLGTVGKRKGALDLMEAIQRARNQGCNLKVWIAGGEEQAGDFVKAQAKLQELQIEDSCELVGIVRGERKAELLEKASLFILPSYSEGLPMAILEAMSASLPIISTPVGGIPEVVRDGHNGYLVPPGDIPALAEKIILLVNNPALRDAFGQRSRAIIDQELDAKPYVQRLAKLYEAILGSSTMWNLEGI